MFDAQGNWIITTCTECSACGARLSLRHETHAPKEPMGLAALYGPANGQGTDRRPLSQLNPCPWQQQSPRRQE
jgi:hypothetical protein